MRTCAIIHPLHLELETAELFLASFAAVVGCKQGLVFLQT
jgi:hypothetical protein